MSCEKARDSGWHNIIRWRNSVWLIKSKTRAKMMLNRTSQNPVRLQHQHQNQNWKRRYPRNVMQDGSKLWMSQAKYSTNSKNTKKNKRYPGLNDLGNIEAIMKMQTQISEMQPKCTHIPTPTQQQIPTWGALRMTEGGVRSTLQKDDVTDGYVASDIGFVATMLL